MFDNILLAVDPISTLYWIGACNAFATGMAGRCGGHGGSVFRCYAIAAVTYAMIGVCYFLQLH